MSILVLPYCTYSTHYIYVMNLLHCLCFQVILLSDKTSNNFSDRAILKSLGKWLGMQTLAKNKPILHIVSYHSYLSKESSHVKMHELYI